jgi:hypothetical protein
MIHDNKEDTVELYCSSYTCMKAAGIQHLGSTTMCYKKTISARQYHVNAIHKCDDCSCIVVPETKRNFSTSNRRTSLRSKDDNSRWY